MNTSPDGYAESGLRLCRPVSVVPAENFLSDFVNQLNVGGDVPELGTGAVWFPGVAGIGHASGGGATVGVPVGDSGLLVAVRTGERGNADADRPTATALAQKVVAGTGG